MPPQERRGGAVALPQKLVPRTGSPIGPLDEQLLAFSSRQAGAYGEVRNIEYRRPGPTSMREEDDRRGTQRLPPIDRYRERGARARARGRLGARAVPIGIQGIDRDDSRAETHLDAVQARGAPRGPRARCSRPERACRSPLRARVGSLLRPRRIASALRGA